MATLVLHPAHTHVSVEKRSCKGTPVSLGSPNGLKMIFALLTEVVAVYMQLIIIYLYYLTLKGLFALLYKLSRSLV